MRSLQHASRPMSRRSLLRQRAGVATLDYVLLMGVVLPLAAVVIPLAMRAMRLVFEFAAVTISWAFL